MKRTIMYALVGAMALGPSFVGAEGATGVAGSVIHAGSKTPIPGVTIVIARDGNPPEDRRQMTTDKKGTFSDIGLQPGVYMVATEVKGQLIGCKVNDVRGGIVRHVQIIVGATVSDTKCVGSTVGGTLDSDETASLYRIH
jgi:hypothetical protein